MHQCCMLPRRVVWTSEELLVFLRESDRGAVKSPEQSQPGQNEQLWRQIMFFSFLKCPRNTQTAVGTGNILHYNYTIWLGSKVNVLRDSLGKKQVSSSIILCLITINCKRLRHHLQHKRKMYIQDKNIELRLTQLVRPSIAIHDN